MHPHVSLHNINFSIAGGKILAIIGIDDNDQTQLAEALSGPVRTESTERQGQIVGMVNHDSQIRRRIGILISGETQ